MVASVINPPNNALETRPDGLAADTGRMLVALPPTLQSGDVTMQAAGDDGVAWEAATYLWRGLDGTVDVIAAAGDVPVQAAGAEAVYRDSAPGISEVWRIDGNRLKHIWRLDALPRPPIPLQAPEFVADGFLSTTLTPHVGGTPQTASFETFAPITLHRPDGGTYSIERVVVTDAKGAVTAGRMIATKEPDGSWHYSVAVSGAWLAEAAYPVEVDPTVSSLALLSFAISAPNMHRHMVRLSDGTLVVAWDSAGNGYPNKARSLDNGATWVNAGAVGSYGMNPGQAFWLATDPTNDYVYLLVYTDAHRLYRSTDKGVTFTQRCADVGAGATYAKPVGIIACDGLVKLVAVDNVATPTVCYTVSSDGGATFPAWTTMGSLPAWTYSSNRGIQHLGLHRKSDGTTGVVVARQSLNSGTGDYSNQVSYYTQLAAGQTPETATGVGGIVTNGAGYFDSAIYNDEIIVLVANSDFGTRQTYKRSTGGTWSSWRAVGGTGTTGALIMGTDGTPYVARYGSSNIVLYKNDGSGDTLVGTIGAATGMHLMGVIPTNVGKYVRLLVETASNTLSYYSYSVNAAPLAPTGLACANFDATAGGTLSWTHNEPEGDPQVQYQTIIERVSDSAVIQDSGAVASAVSSRAIAGGVLANGVQYRFKVRTSDVTGNFGPYSAYTTFWCSAKPTVTITTPGATFGLPKLTAVGTYSDPTSGVKSAGQWRLLTEANEVLWTSGKAAGAGLNSGEIPYRLTSGVTYKIGFTAWDDFDIPSTEVVVTFAVTYTPPPTPTLTVTPDNANGHVDVTITNPAGSPAVASNDLYRRQTGTTAWTRLAAALAVNSSYVDRTAGNGAWEYMARATTSMEVTADSAATAGTVIIEGVFLHIAADPTSSPVNFALDPAKSAKRDKPITFNRYAGRAKPVALIGEAREHQVTVRLDLANDTTARASLLAIWSQDAVVCYRDSVRRIFGVLGPLPEDDQWWGSEASITVTEVDYEEAV